MVDATFPVSCPTFSLLLLKKQAYENITRLDRTLVCLSPLNQRQLRIPPPLAYLTTMIDPATV